MVFEETGPYFYILMLQRSMVMRYLSIDRQQRRTVQAEAPAVLKWEEKKIIK